MKSSLQLNELLHDLRVRRTRRTALAGKGADLDPHELLGEIGELAVEDRPAIRTGQGRTR